MVPAASVPHCETRLRPPGPTVQDAAPGRRRPDPWPVDAPLRDAAPARVVSSWRSAASAPKRAGGKATCAARKACAWTPCSTVTYSWRISATDRRPRGWCNAGASSRTWHPPPAAAAPPNMSSRRRDAPRRWVACYVCTPGPQVALGSTQSSSATLRRLHSHPAPLPGSVAAGSPGLCGAHWVGGNPTFPEVAADGYAQYAGGRSVRWSAAGGGGMYTGHQGIGHSIAHLIETVPCTCMRVWHGIVRINS